MEKDTTEHDYNYIESASYQCLSCNKTHEKLYDPPVLWSIFDHERTKKQFVCPDCNIACEPIAHYLEIEAPPIQESEQQAVIPNVTEEEISFVIKTIKKEASYDEPSIKQLFYGMATAFTRLGMGHKVNSKDSGTGKSYLTNKVAGYYPN